MAIIRTVAVVALMMLGTVASAVANDTGIEQRLSEDAIAVVDQRLRATLAERGMTLMTVVDHRANAMSVGLDLPETRTFIFGNPRVGTPMMQCQGSMALDLPQKMVVRETGEGVRLEWNSPHYLAERHALEECDLPLDKVAGVLEGVAAAAAGQ